MGTFTSIHAIANADRMESSPNQLAGAAKNPVGVGETYGVRREETLRQILRSQRRLCSVKWFVFMFFLGLKQSPNSYAGRFQFVP
jgi:hypothetical protein